MRSFRKTAMLLVLPTAAFTVVTQGAASASPARHPRPHFVSVVGNGSRVSVSQPVLREGRVTFSVRSTNPGDGSDITLFRPRAGHTLAEVFADLAEEFSETPATAAKGTRDLTRDAAIYGLADISPARGALVTRNLRAGTYYLMDLANPPSGPPETTTLTVMSHSGYRAKSLRGHARATIKMTSSDRFRIRGSMPARGTVRVANVSDTLHFVAFQRVKRGTTDRQVQQYFQSPGGPAGPPPWGMQSPAMGTDVLSPGQSLKLTYRLHRGTYVLMCFVADDETGMPHAFMGMHKVVRFR